MEPLYSQRKDQASAFPKLLRVLVSYQGKVGYAPTISEALSQVGIDPKAAQDLGEARNLGKVPKKDDANKDQSNQKESPKPSAPATGTGAAGEAIQKINDALKALETAKGKSNEEYGRAIDQLDKAVQDYRHTIGG